MQVSFAVQNACKRTFWKRNSPVFVEPEGLGWGWHCDTHLEHRRVWL